MQEQRAAEFRAEMKEEKRNQKANEKQQRREREEQTQLRSYSTIMREENMRSNTETVATIDDT